jgi:hypothetical protein
VSNREVGAARIGRMYAAAGRSAVRGRVGARRGCVENDVLAPGVRRDARYCGGAPLAVVS